MANKKDVMVKVKAVKPILLKGGIKKLKDEEFKTCKEIIEPYIASGAVVEIKKEKKNVAEKDIKNAEKQERFKEKVVTK